MNNKTKKFNRLAIIILLAFIVQGVAPILRFNTANAIGTTTWTQTDWSGGDGQSTWSDITKFSSEGEDGVYVGEEIKMEIDADVVIGQEDFAGGDTDQGGSIEANAINDPFSAYTDGQRIFIPDGNNHRVLIYNEIPTENDAAADVVIGQSDFTSGDANQGGSVASNTLYNPKTVYTYGEKLFVLDRKNHRVLIYNEIPTENNASADVVIGQADFTGGLANQGGSAANNTINAPYSIYVDDGKLFIADAYNNRVLIYNEIPTTNDAAADVVIGQPDFTSTSANQGGSVASNTLYSPYSVRVNDNKLFVADLRNFRVLIYNEIPTTNDAAADVVIGQPNFTSNSANQGGSVADNAIDIATGIHIDSNRLFVADVYNNRILLYNEIPTVNNASADQVLGQPNFTSNSANQGGDPARNTLARPYAPFADSSRFVTADTTNHRVLLFNKTRATSTLTSSTYETATEQDFGPITWNAQTTSYSEIKMEVSTDEGLTFQEVQNNQEFIGRGTSITYKVTLISKDGLSTPTFQDISISHQDPSNEDIDNVELKLNNKKTELQKNKRILIEKKKTKISGQNTKLVNGEVKIYRNKKKIEEEDVDENGNWNTDLKFKKSKKYTLTFKFYDQHGTKLDSQKYKVKIDLEDPTFTDFPANNIYKKRGAKLYWSAEDNDKVKKYKATLNGKITKTKDSFITVPQNTPTGTHTFTVKVYDKAGNTAKQSINVRVY